jgi:hypothetical protein
MLLDFSSLIAQESVSANDSIPVSSEVAVSYYYKFTDQRSRLYNGKQFITYNPAMEGHAYFMDADMHRGSVVYDGLFFDSVNLQYDLVKDEVVIQHFDAFFKIVLIGDKLKAFNLNGHHYKRLVRDTINKLPVSTGFYDFLYDGKIKFIAKRTKNIEEIVTDKVVQKIVEKNFYYVIRDNVYYQVRSYKSLLSIFKDRSREIRQDLRKQKLKFRKNREALILRAVTFYDSSKN